MRDSAKGGSRTSCSTMHVRAGRWRSVFMDPIERGTMPQISEAVAAAGQAVSVRYNNMVYDLRRRGEKVIVLSLGEAFFDIPLFSMDALPNPELYHYSHSRGLIDLREKIAQYYEGRFGVAVDPETEIIITAGSKAAIHFAM